MPSSTLAGLFCSSGALRFLVGDTGTSTADCGLGSSILRRLAAVLGLEAARVLSSSPSPDACAFASRAFCNFLSFNLASICASFSCRVSSSSSSSSSSSTLEIGRRFAGDGETELRWRRCSYFRRPDGELKSASCGDLGGQFRGGVPAMLYQYDP